MRRLVAILALASVALPTKARADVSDLTGLDARTRGMGMATLTLCEDWTSAACNPAAGAMATRVSVGLGYSLTSMNLRTNGAPTRLMDARGTVLGVNTPFRIRDKVTIAFGLTGYLPDQFLARVQLVPASEPRFVLLDHRPHRLVLDMAASLQPVRWLSLGLGGTILADAAGNGITFNVGVKGGTKVGETGIDLVLPMRVAPLAGLLLKPLPWLRIGAAYRGEIDLGVRLDILANVDVAGIVTGDAIITLRAINYYTPHRVEVGISADPHPRVTLAAGLVWEMWSRSKGGVADVRILVDLGLNPPMVQAFFPPDNFRDVLGPRAGVEYRHPLRGGHELAARAGYAYAPSPVPDQTGLTALMDSDRHVVTLGLGFRYAKLASWFPFPVNADLGFQYHALSRRRVYRNLLSDPLGGVLQSEGGLLSLAGTVRLEF